MGSIAGFEGADGERWTFGRGRPLGGSLLRWGLRRLGRMDVVVVVDVVVAGLGCLGWAVVVGTDTHSEDLAGDMSVSRRGEVFSGAVL